MLPIGYGMPPACGLRPAEQVVKGVAPRLPTRVLGTARDRLLAYPP